MQQVVAPLPLPRHLQVAGRVPRVVVEQGLPVAAERVLQVVEDPQLGAGPPQRPLPVRLQPLQVQRPRPELQRPRVRWLRRLLRPRVRLQRPIQRLLRLLKAHLDQLLEPGRRLFRQPRPPPTGEVGKERLPARLGVWGSQWWDIGRRRPSASCPATRGAGGPSTQSICDSLKVGGYVASPCVQGGSRWGPWLIYIRHFNYLESSFAKEIRLQFKVSLKETATTTASVCVRPCRSLPSFYLSLSFRIEIS